MKKQSKTAQIRALLEAGKTVKEIAAKLKVKPAAVYQVRHKMSKDKEQIKEFAEKFIARDFKSKKPRVLRNTSPADKGPSFDQVFMEIGENARKLGAIIADIKPADIKPADSTSHPAHYDPVNHPLHEVLATPVDATDHPAHYDPVNHPPHYKAGGIEVIDFIEAKQLGYHLGNVIKYISRAYHKGGMEDLLKAQWYLNRAIEKGEV